MLWVFHTSDQQQCFNGVALRHFLTGGKAASRFSWSVQDGENITQLHRQLGMHSARYVLIIYQSYSPLHVSCTMTRPILGHQHSRPKAGFITMPCRSFCPLPLRASMSTAPVVKSVRARAMLQLLLIPTLLLILSWRFLLMPFWANHLMMKCW